MSYVKVRKRVILNEASAVASSQIGGQAAQDQQAQAQGQDTTNAAKDQGNDQLQSLYTKATQIQQTMQNIRRQLTNYNNQLIMLNKQIASAGGTPIPITT